ncbi:MAG: hypothetical protein CMB58_003305 [Methanobacteriota archaeon]|nr:MAG: hypothetical protein CMB58_003305 [Euryarchaeota archaeon]
MARTPRFPLTRKRRLLIVGCSMSLLLVLMFVSVEPEVQYSIDEVMDDPTAYEGELHVRGEVSIGSLETDNFSFSISGVKHVLHVDYSSTVIPDGFDEGNMIAIKGDLLIIDGLWVIEAHEIQTGCPSKYEASQ